MKGSRIVNTSEHRVRPVTIVETHKDGLWEHAGDAKLPQSEISGSKE